MGWSSGTDLFDTVMAELVKEGPIDKVRVIRALLKAMEDEDWDCQNESEYWNHPLVQEANALLHPPRAKQR